MISDKVYRPEKEPRQLSANEVDAGFEAGFQTGEDGENHADSLFKTGIAELASKLASLRSEDLNPNNANPDDFSTINLEGAKKWGGERVEQVQTKIQETLEKTTAALAEGNINQAATEAKGLFGSLKDMARDQLPEFAQGMFDEVVDTLDKAVLEGDPAAQDTLYKFACGAADFIPVAGPLKMSMEAVYGKTMGGEELTGWKRFMHGAEGVVFTAVDLTGFGAVATKLAKGGKAGLMAPKLMTRTAALMRKAGVAKKAYRPLFQGGQFLMRHPKLAEYSTRAFIKMEKGRRVRKITELPKALASEAAVGNVSQREGLSLVPPANQEFPYQPPVDDSSPDALAA